MTTAEAATLLDCDQSHVRRLVRDGTLRGRSLTSRMLLVERASVEYYAAHRPKGGWPKGKARKTPPAPS